MATLANPHRLFHFTGHAAHNYRHPQQSALALTGEDLLTAEEIASLPLHPYELVTLAACETAVTTLDTIETDYVGLASAFLTAGAKQVISTLWTVDSESNAWLMVNFYQRYLSGTPRPDCPLPIATVAAKHHTFRPRSLARSFEHVRLPSRLSLRTRKPSPIKIGEHKSKSSKLEATLPYADPYYWAAFTLTGVQHNLP